MGALGLVVNAICLWNTRYMNLALDDLRAEGCKGHPAASLPTGQTRQTFSQEISEHERLLTRCRLPSRETVTQARGPEL